MPKIRAPGIRRLNQTTTSSRIAPITFSGRAAVTAIGECAVPSSATATLTAKAASSNSMCRMRSWLSRRTSPPTSTAMASAAAMTAKNRNNGYPVAAALSG